MNFEEKKEQILKGPIPKILISLAAPIMFNNFIQTLYNLSDTYWVSRLGSEEVAAMTLVFPVIFLILSIAMGMNIAGTSLISQYIGANQEDQANKVASQLFSFLLVLSVFLGLLGYFFTPHMISLMGGTGNVHLYGSQYLSIMFLEMPVIFMFIVYNAIMQGQGNTFTPMILNVAGSLLNIVLSPVFIFGLGPIPYMGIRGAAIATLISRAIFVGYGIYTLFMRKDGIIIRKKYLSPDLTMLRKIIKVGLPASIGQSAAAFGFIVLNMFVLSYGDSALAAFGIGNRINSVVMMPAMGIGNAVAPIVGQNLGADQILRARSTFKISILMSTVFMAIGGFIAFLLAEDIIRIFAAEDPVVIALGTDYLQLISLSIPLMGIFQILNGLFQGSGHTMYAMFINMFRLWGLRIPMIYLFGRLTDLGADAIWYSMVLSNFIICIIGFGIYLSRKWEKKVIEDEPEIHAEKKKNVFAS